MTALRVQVKNILLILSEIDTIQLVIWRMNRQRLLTYLDIHRETHAIGDAVLFQSTSRNRYLL